MAKAAARVGDKAKQQSPHCHAPIHPPAPSPTPTPHSALPLAILPPGSVTVRIDNMPAARAGDMTAPCMLPGCVPAGPGMIASGSTNVLIDMRPAAREGDPTAHTSCVAVIPAPTGEIQGPCSSTVKFG